MTSAVGKQISIIMTLPDPVVFFKDTRPCVYNIPTPGIKDIQKRGFLQKIIKIKIKQQYCSYTAYTLYVQCTQCMRVDNNNYTCLCVARATVKSDVNLMHLSPKPRQQKYYILMVLIIRKQCSPGSRINDRAV